MLFLAFPTSCSHQSVELTDLVGHFLSKQIFSYPRLQCSRPCSFFLSSKCITRSFSSLEQWILEGVKFATFYFSSSGFKRTLCMNISRCDVSCSGLCSIPNPFLFPFYPPGYSRATCCIIHGQSTVRRFLSRALLSPCPDIPLPRSTGSCRPSLYY